MVTEFDFNIIVDDEKTSVSMVVKKTENIDIVKLQGLLRNLNAVPTIVKNRIDKALDRLPKPEDAAADNTVAVPSEDEAPASAVEAADEAQEEQSTN